MAYATIDIGDAASVDALWSTSDTLPPENIMLGGRFESGPLVIGLIDGSLAADGNPITNPAGWHHNGAESKVKHTDAIVSAYDNAYATSGVFNELDNDDYLAITPYTGSIVQQLRKYGGNCFTFEVVLYEDGYVVTPESFTKTEPWRTKYSSDCGVQPEAVTFNGAVVSYNGDIVTYSE